MPQAFDIVLTLECSPNEEHFITQDDVKQHILDAVTVWGGQKFPGDEHHPPDPFFNYPTVTIRKIRNVRKGTSSIRKALR